MGGVTTIPASVMQRPSGSQGADFSGLLQLAMAAKQMKMQEEDRKKSQASQTLEAGIKMIQQGVQIDPKVIGKAMKTLGLGDIAEVQPAPPAASAPPTSGNVPGGSLPLPTNVKDLTALSAAMGNKAGAQSATPPSKQAQERAPGGGVSNDFMTPEMSSSLADQARQRFGSLAPLYLGALSQQQIAAMQAKHEQMVQEIQSKVDDSIASGKPDARLMGQLFLMSGKTLNDSETKNIYAMLGSPEQQSQFLDFLQGSTSATELAKNSTDILKSLMTDYPDAPVEDLRKASIAAASGNEIPLDVQNKLSSVQSIAKSTDAFYKLATNFPLDVARRASIAVGAGIPIAQAVPKGASSLAEQTMRIKQEELGVQIQTKNIEAAKYGLEAEKYKQETAKLAAAEADKQAEQDVKDLEAMVVAKKAGVKIDPETLTRMEAKVAARAGMTLQEVHHWYGTSTLELVPNLSEQDKELVSRAAGGKAPQQVTPDEVKSALSGVEHPTEFLRQHGGVTGLIKDYYHWYYTQAIPGAGQAIKKGGLSIADFVRAMSGKGPTDAQR